jgi:hypothetical protein
MKLPIGFVGTCFAASILIVSCKKDGTAPPANNTNRVKIYIEDATATPYNRIDTFNISYDNTGRITSLASRTGSQFLYQYNTGSYTMDIKNGAHLIIRQLYYLNSSSLVDSTFQFNDTQDSSTEKYIYNAANQLMQVKDYEYSHTGARLDRTTHYTYDNNGNAIREAVTDDSGDTTERKSYTYSPVLNTVNLGQQYFPVLFKNLRTNMSNLSSTGTVISYTNYTYTFDNMNRVATETDTDSYGNIVVKKYIYE